MSAQGTSRPAWSARPIGRWVALTLVAGAAVAFSSAIGILPTRSLAGAGGVQAMVAAAAAVWFVHAVAAVPIAMAPRSNPRNVLQALLVGMGVRFVLALGLALMLTFGTGLPRTALVLWMAIHYMTALGIGTVVEARMLRNDRSETER